MHRIILRRLLMPLILLSCGRFAAAQNLTVEHWQGQYPVDELHRFLADDEIGGVGYIASQETWEAVWQGFSSDAVPPVQFPNEIVVYARNVNFVNIISPLAVSLDDQGTAEVLAASTLTARPIEDFVYWSAATIPSEGVLQLGSAGQSLSVQVPEPRPVSIALFAVMALTLRRRKQRATCCRPL